MVSGIFNYFGLKTILVCLNMARGGYAKNTNVLLPCTINDKIYRYFLPLVLYGFLNKKPTKYAEGFTLETVSCDLSERNI